MSYLGNQPATGENNSFKILDDITSYTLTFDGASSSIVSVADDTITKYEHRFITGQRVTYTHGGGTAIGGLTSGSVYYIVKNDQNTIKLAPSYADAIGSTNLINLSGLGVGTSHTLNVAFDGVNTKFKATYDNGTKAGITRAAQLQISINGVIQRPFDSVTPASGFGFDLDSVIVFSTAPASTDVFWGNLVANNFPTFDIADNDIDNFTGDAVTTSFTLSKTPANSQNILVTLDGVVQYPSDNDTTRAYTLSENVLTFDSAPGNGVFIQVRHIGFAGATSSEVTGFYGRTGNVALRYIDDIRVGDIDSVGFSTFTATGIGTVKIGIGNTALLVEGEARVTGILTVGNSSITLDGTTNKITIGSDDTFIQNGVIGIGTTNVENYALNVSGTANISGNATIGGNANIKSFDYAGISSSISDTAVDIFVYDTSKDSDGGAWRKRTQHTSWYNETLNTATRGSRREFPSVAVIVSESDTLTIYDGDDPDLPMWMVFTTTGTVTANAIVRSSGYDISTVSMINGLLVCGVNYNGGYEINFVSDKCHRRNPSVYAFGGNVASRNGGMSFITLNTTDVTVNSTVNDVAMTVLPNAPIDETTGLPVPTIAVGTDGGISVIKDDGTVIDMQATSTTNYRSPSIAITKDEKILLNTSTNTADNYSIFHVIPLSIFTSDRSYTYEYEFLNEGFYQYSSGNSGSLSLYNSTSTFFEDVIETKLGYIAVGSNFGLKNIQHIPQDLVSGGRSSLGDARFNGGMQCGITTNYNTGWMHSNIKGAFLSGISTASISGSNLMSGATYNGSDRITSYSYTAGSNTLVIDDDEATADGYVSLTLGGLSPSTTYIVTVTADNAYTPTSGYNHHMGSTADGTIYFDDSFVGTTTQQSLSFTTQTSADPTIVLYSGYSGGNLTYTIDLRISDLNRSAGSVRGWNAAQTSQTGFPSLGLGVYGTITKTPVATGAELVAYSGFSASNYLLQPYNSDLDFGTGDYSIILWAYRTVNDTMILVDKSRQDASQTNRFVLYFDNSNGFVVLYEANSAGSALTGDTTLQLNRWTQIAYTRAGSIGSLYMDGELVGTVARAPGTVSDSNHKLVIGNGYDNSYAWEGSLALVRLSASAPSAEQIKKIYEDEKVLFQENAACTLYGSSDTVTALAYDDKEELLHVGTSSGRSDFRGLRRINNTETAVTTAISAYDGLIAQQ